MAHTVLVPGIVLDRDGNPVSSVAVTFVDGPEDYEGPAAVTDGEGRFALAAPAPGRWTIGFASDTRSGTVEADLPTDWPLTLRSG